MRSVCDEVRNRARNQASVQIPDRVWWRAEGQVWGRVEDPVWYQVADWVRQGVEDHA